jgi:hypothetical protein
MSNYEELLLERFDRIITCLEKLANLQEKAMGILEDVIYVDIGKLPGNAKKVRAK